eukprot:m.335657 g.335657  ORF g.335657 m.335657 type:complete len:174 (+) comp17644_c0_seq1:277-798(+)
MASSEKCKLYLSVLVCNSTGDWCQPKYVETVSRDLRNKEQSVQYIKMCKEGHGVKEIQVDPEFTLGLLANVLVFAVTVKRITFNGGNNVAANKSHQDLLQRALDTRHTLLAIMQGFDEEVVIRGYNKWEHKWRDQMMKQVDDTNNTADMVNAAKNVKYKAENRFFIYEQRGVA